MANSQVILSQAFETIRTLLRSMTHISNELSRAFDSVSLAAITFPSPAMPLDEELAKATGCLNYFTTEAKDISSGIRAQVKVICEQLMEYDDESWEKVGVEIGHLGNVKDSLSKTISGIVGVKHTIKNIDVDAGPKTYRIQIAKTDFTKEIDCSLEVLQSAIMDYAEILEIFKAAKAASETMRDKRGD